MGQFYTATEMQEIIKKKTKEKLDGESITDRPIDEPRRKPKRAKPARAGDDQQG